MITHPFKAAGAFIKALPLVLSKDLRLFILAPLLANFLLIALLYLVAFRYLDDGVASVMGYFPEWVSFIDWLLELVVMVLLGVLLFYSFSVGVNILAGPFMAFLVEKVEKTSDINFSKIRNTSSCSTNDISISNW